MPHIDPSLLGLALFLRPQAKRSVRATVSAMILRRWRAFTFVVLVAGSLGIGFVGNWGKGNVPAHDSATPARADCIFITQAASSANIISIDQILGAEHSTRPVCASFPMIGGKGRG